MRIGGRELGSIGFGTARIAFSALTFDQAVAAVRSALDAEIGRAHV